MGWLFLVIGALVVFAVAAAFVGSESFRLGHEPHAAIFDLDEAVDHVAEGLPADAQGRLTYDEVGAIIVAALEHLETKGLSAFPGEDPAPGPATGGTGAPDPVIVADDDAVAVVLGRLDEAGIVADDSDVFSCIELLLDYLDRIGALGPRFEG